MADPSDPELLAQGAEGVIDQLRSEEPATPTRDDAVTWIDVYRQLINLTEEMLDRTRRYVADLQPPARRHVERVNVRIMEEELSAFRDRERWWQARLRALDQ